ncbi:hypothetical protein WICMUC_005536 [Wickerhamomyces mucosus]|uniref:RGS domain-containing protein n=1 Tax=Wickerhamomyces mucosus TaxID=1378264 RepID=A0A9P8P8P0_9ASCO|nr:hypothetical protein WICMUC_005536 [Wickerhamomyces mucosus]
MNQNVPSLENLINQCCEEYYLSLARRNSLREDTHVKSECHDRNNSYYYNFQKFKQFIIELHCQENLKFLIEIYHYEKIWNKIFKRKYSILKCKESSSTTNDKSINISSSSNITTQSPDSKSMSTSLNGGHNIVSKTRQDSILSMISEEYDLDINDVNNLFKDLDIDLNMKSHEDSLSDLNSNWSNLFKKQYQENRTNLDHETQKHNIHKHDHEGRINSQTLECMCQNSNKLKTQFGLNNSQIQSYLLNQLQLKFQFIIKNFILRNSPFEINLPVKIYDSISVEYQNDKIKDHNPLIFLHAKNHILQILRENIYFKFLKIEQLEYEKNQSNNDKLKNQIKVDQLNNVSQIPKESSSSSNDQNIWKKLVRFIR